MTGHWRPLLPLIVLFGVFGVMFGAWQVLLPELVLSLSLSPGALGAALSGGFVASLPAMALGGKAVDRWGAAVTIGASALGIAVAVAAVASVGSFAALVALLLLFFAASGIYDVAINAAAMHTGEGTGGTAMSIVHASFSGGGAAGALTMGALLLAGVSPRTGYLAIAVMLIVVAAWCLTLRATLGGGRVAPTDRGVPAHRQRTVLLVALLVALAFLCEGVMENWSAIYLRSTFAASAALGASGVAVFHGAMFVGRLATTGLLRHASRTAVLRASGALAAVGMLVAIATASPVATLAGFLVVGLALSSVAPLGFSLAGDAAPDARGSASAVITTVGYVGFVVGPAAVGGIAELASLRMALGIVVVSGILIAAFGSRAALPHVAPSGLAPAVTGPG